MFLAAVARPRYDPYKKTKFNGKIGIWPFTEESVAQRSRANRPKGSLVTKNIESIDSHVYKDYIINKVIPAIKKVWPRDLGFFASIQSLQLRKGAHGIKMLVEAVTAAYEQISIETLDNVFLSLQSVMLCALACNGGNEYKLPHSSKARLR
ncbi:hypothetical protein PC119_g13738 [Phytophthora cactorum]|nr:hypothetical protein PC111_g22775 [Phytophthora cactorum]KAG3009839.1 hypothetical protein PC119_g13738 [Phytophthora cactorum]